MIDPSDWMTAPVLAWLRKVREPWGYAYGSELAEILTRTTCVDGSRYAEELLGAMEQRGWIKRRSHVPSPSQRFAGVGGSTKASIGTRLETQPAVTCSWERGHVEPPLRQPGLFDGHGGTR